MAKQPWYQYPDSPLTSPQNAKIAVVGAGIVGCMTAAAFAKMGFRVTLIERQANPAAAASGNPAGVVMPVILDDDDPARPFYDVAYQTAIALYTNFAKKGGWVGCGVEELVGGGGKPRYYEDAGYVVPAALCNVLLSLYGNCITLLSHCDAIGLDSIAGGGWCVTCCGKENIEVDVVIVANAVDAAGFTQCQELPLHNVRGQLTYVPQESIGDRSVDHVIYYPGGYITPAVAIEGLEGRYHMVGATFDRRDPEEALRLDDNNKNIKNLLQHSDIKLKNARERFEGRVAFRATTPDRLPLLGFVPDYAAYMEDYAGLHHGSYHKKWPLASYHQGLFINVGHGSRGMLTAPLCAELLLHMVCGSAIPTGLSLNSFVRLHPARFWIRELKRSP